MNLLEKIIAVPHFAISCAGGNFLSFPTWYKYLPGTVVNGACTPVVNSLSDVWLIVAAVIEILIRLASIVAVGIIIYAGIEYMTSQGNPERTGRAQATIIGAAVGLAITILAAVLVTFIAETISS